MKSNEQAGTGLMVMAGIIFLLANIMHQYEANILGGMYLGLGILCFKAKNEVEQRRNIVAK